jgi:hypothetical protein
MAPPDRDSAIKCIADLLALPLSASSCTLRARFWPRLPISDDSLRARYSEPDLVIADASGAVMIVEVKWGAPLSGHELAAQWAALSGAERRVAIHVLLVQEPELYRSKMAEDAVLLERRGLQPWRLFLRSWWALTGLPTIVARPDTSEAVRRWAAAVSAFLRREHRYALHGWDGIGLQAIQPLAWHFRQPWFDEVPEVSRHEGWWASV